MGGGVREVRGWMGGGVREVGGGVLRGEGADGR